MEKTPTNINDEQLISNKETGLLKWSTSILMSILFILTGILYNNLGIKDASADNRITVLEQNDVSKDTRLLNLEWNVYLMCINQSKKIDCIKPQGR